MRSRLHLMTRLKNLRAPLLQEERFQIDVSRLRVQPSRLIIPNAAEESQHKICCIVSFVSSELHPDVDKQFHCCRKPMPSQAPKCSNQVRFTTAEIVNDFLLYAMIGHQPSLPRNHGAFPLTLNRSASPIQSESPYVNTEPTRALFTASRLSVVGRTVMIRGFVV